MANLAIDESSARNSRCGREMTIDFIPYLATLYNSALVAARLEVATKTWESLQV